MEGQIVSILVIAGRVFIPLTILRWPLGGALLAIMADILDSEVLDIFGWGYFGNGHYQYLDKVLDTWYLFFELIIVYGWENKLARRLAKFLFVWRLFGVLIFEATGWRQAIFFAPNVFEFFYLVCIAIQKYRPKYILTAKRLAAVFLLAAIPKIFIEYYMHFVHADQAWGFVRENFFRLFK